MLQTAVLLALLFYVYGELTEEENFGREFWHHGAVMFGKNSLPMLLFPVLLMPVNWTLESLKWQLLIRKIYPLSLKEAFKGVLSGLSVGLVSHRMAGDAAGRLAFIPSGYRKKATGAMLISQICQTFATYFFGSFGLIYWLTYQKSAYSKWAMGLPLVLGIALILVFILIESLSFKTFQRKVFRYLSGFMKGLRLYSYREYAGASVLAIIRYFIFSLQMVWVLYIAGVVLPWTVLFAGVSCIFLAKTILPSMGFLAELGIRSGSALFFFGHFGVDESAVILGSLWIWLINVMIPALAGGLMIWRFKPVTSREA